MSMPDSEPLTLHRIINVEYCRFSKIVILIILHPVCFPALEVCK